MRQTLVKEGIQERLPDLMGDGVSTYSIQSSMLEDMKRVCVALVGDYPNGRVMAGMEVDDQGVDAGYCITPDGKLIKFSKRYDFISSQTDIISTSQPIQVYAIYAEQETDDATNGHMSFFSRTTGRKQIIRDQLGANDDGDSSLILTVEASSTARSRSGYCHIATIQKISETEFVSTRPTGSSTRTTDFTYSNRFTATLWSGASTLWTTTTNGITANSETLLEYGYNKLRSIDIFMPSNTSSIRTTSEQHIFLNVMQKPDESVLTSIEILDSYIPVMRHFDLNTAINSGITALYLTATITTTTNAFIGTTGTSKFLITIDKLT